MMNSEKLRKKTFELYKKAIIEINKSVKLLTSKNLNLSTVAFTRQLFEVARTLEILADHPEFTCAYYLEVRKTELSKVKKSKLHQSNDYLSNTLEPEIKKLKESMASQNVAFKDWTDAKDLWNKKNKDTIFYNKISEALHLDINYLVVYYLQTQENAENLGLEEDWDEQGRINLSKELFDHWLKRCNYAIQSIVNH